ncbi:peptidylprolyl isomerase [Albidovulum sp.]
MRTFLLRAGLAVLCALPPAIAAAADPSADTVVAKVNGAEITLGHMIAIRESLPPQYLQLDDKVLFDGILDQLIQQETLAEAAAAHLTRRDELMLENQKRGYLAGVTLDAVARAAVTDDAVRALYDETYAKADPGKEYNASHILVKTEDEARAIIAELEGGADFATLAKEKSTGPSGPNGGELGWFGPGMMVKPFEDAVVALQPGEISGPVETQFGWHVIRLNEVRNATVPSLDEAREQIEGDLRQKAVEQAVADMTAKAEVTKMVDGIDPAILKRTELIGE